MAEPGHPDWCALGHQCWTGEHRSEALRVHGLVLTRVARGSREWVEYRGSALLTGGGEQAAQLAAAIDLAVRAVTTGDVEALVELIAVAGPR